MAGLASNPRSTHGHPLSNLQEQRLQILWQMHIHHCFTSATTTSLHHKLKNNEELQITHPLHQLHHPQKASLSQHHLAKSSHLQFSQPQSHSYFIQGYTLQTAIFHFQSPINFSKSGILQGSFTSSILTAIRRKLLKPKPIRARAAQDKITPGRATPGYDSQTAFFFSFPIPHRH